jgi:hypothetical protein
LVTLQIFWHAKVTKYGKEGTRHAGWGLVRDGTGKTKIGGFVLIPETVSISASVALGALYSEGSGRVVNKIEEPPPREVGLEDGFGDRRDWRDTATVGALCTALDKNFDGYSRDFPKVIF